MHILVVDDDKIALNVLIDAVKEAVPIADIHGFLSPVDAFEFGKKTKCDVVFLDIQMREMNGIILARKLIEIYPKVNIIFVTGYSEYMNEAFSMHASGYIDKPASVPKIINEMENLRYPVNWKDRGVFIQTFGNFELLVNDERVNFGRSKSKEMLAYLVDRKGQSVTRKELASVLFEKKPYTRQLQDYLSKIIRELFNTLEKVGAESILKRYYNSYSVNINAFTCDYYNYEKPDATPEDLNRFKGEYMNQYSWAQSTLALIHQGEK